jgi:hypothetical protein
MKALPKNVGAEPKKLALLGAILVLGGVVYWIENRSDAPVQTVAASTLTSAGQPQTVGLVPPLPGTVSESRPSARTADPVISVPQRHAAGSTGSGGAFPGNSRTMEDFHPSLKVKDDLDVSKIDPRIRQDLLVKVRAVPMEGGSRSLFEFSKAPEALMPKVDPIKPGPVTVPPPAVAAKQAPKEPPGPPPPPPIPFKYYGYAGKATDGQLQGFFREGDASTGDIFTAHEDQTLKNRYKIIRIGIKSAVVEDTTNQRQETLPLLEEAQ